MIFLTVIKKLELMVTNQSEPKNNLRKSTVAYENVAEKANESGKIFKHEKISYAAKQLLLFAGLIGCSVTMAHVMSLVSWLISFRAMA